MSDDQDGCEWVNVSSGTLVDPDQRPLNVCVCVCVLWSQRSVLIVSLFLCLGKSSILVSNLDRF